MRGVDQVGWLGTKGFIAALLNGHHQISPLRPMSRGEFDFISQIIGQAESTIITREPSTARFFNSHLIGKWFDPELVNIVGLNWEQKCLGDYIENIVDYLF